MLFSDLFNRLSSLSFLLDPTAASTAEDGPGRVKQVAIIGAGAAGASTAYHLQKFAEQAGIAINVTIFEKTNHIGGRSLTVNAFDDPLQPVELGASIFVAINHILFNATKEFGLSTIDPGTDESGLLGIWDGESFVYQQDDASWEWWSVAKMLWKYGTAPYYTRKLVHKTTSTFLKLYQAPYFPFRSLTTRVYELDLIKVTRLTGLQFLAENKLDGPFAREIVQTGTRVNYASNLAYIHGMETMVSMAAEGAMAVKGGNWQIFSNMVKASQASVYLNTTVQSLSVKTSKDPKATAPRYTITTANSGSSASKSESHPILFDDVVIAAPYQFSGISHEDDLIQHPIDEIPYVKLHVTLFASPFRFSPEFFNLEPATVTPISVLTTLGKDEEALPGAAGVGRAGFFSATQVRRVTNPKTLGTEYVYKIFSPHKVTPEFLSSLLGVQVPETFTRQTDSEDEEEYNVVEPISWYHPAVFHPYPQELPRVTFQDPILREGLYYTSGIESFISTMETSALMGMNVARLIVDDYLDALRGEQLDKNTTFTGTAEDQKVLKETEIPGDEL